MGVASIFAACHTQWSITAGSAQHGLQTIPRMFLRLDSAVWHTRNSPHMAYIYRHRLYDLTCAVLRGAQWLYIMAHTNRSRTLRIQTLASVHFWEPFAQCCRATALCANASPSLLLQITIPMGCHYLPASISPAQSRQQQRPCFHCLPKLVQPN